MDARAHSLAILIGKPKGGSDESASDDGGDDEAMVTAGEDLHDAIKKGDGLGIAQAVANICEMHMSKSAEPDGDEGNDSES